MPLFSALVISDLHIGVKGDDADDFKLDEEKFISYLNRSLERNNLVILNGDIFECWEGHGLSKESQQEQLDKIKETRPELFAALTAGGKLKLIIGNHDGILLTGKTETGALSHYTVKMEGFEVYFAHGHQSDVYNNEHGCCGRLISYCMGKGERLIDPDLDHKLEAIYDICTSRRYSDVTANHAFSLALMAGYDCVVYGHTHEPMVRKNYDIIYGNSGHGRDFTDRIDEVSITWGSGSLNVKSVRRNITTDEIISTFGDQTIEKNSTAAGR